MAANYWRHTQGELAIFSHRQSACASALARDAIRHYIISHTETGQRPAGSACLLQKEVGLMRGVLGGAAQPPVAAAATDPLSPVCDLIVVPLFETIEDLRNAAPIMREFYALAWRCGPGAAQRR